MNAFLYLAETDWDGHMDWGDGWGIVMMLGMFIFWLLVVALIVWLVREVVVHRGGKGDGKTPLEMLDERLAQGTISPEDYEERRRILSSTAPTSAKS